MKLKIEHLTPFLEDKEPKQQDSSGEVFDPVGRGKRLLVVDDEADIRTLLVRHLARLGHECVEAATGKEAIALVHTTPFDAVLTDIRMPEMTGMELLRQIKDYDQNLAVVMITANEETKGAVHAMKMGADDYILKPFNLLEVSVGLGRALEKRELKLQIQEYQKNLESMVMKRTSQVQRLFLNVIQALVYTLEAKDRYTDGHSRRVAWLALQLGEAGGVEGRDLELVQVGGVFHDLGKIGVRESILLKKGSLTPEEYDQVKWHPDIGVRILKPLEELHEILPIVRHHHERYDGGGYPSGLRGGDIPIGARIVSVVDAFDAMTSARPYREARPVPEAISRLQNAAGSQLDPHLVDLFTPLAEDKKLQEVLFSPNWTLGGESPQLAGPDVDSHKHTRHGRYCEA